MLLDTYALLKLKFKCKPWINLGLQKSISVKNKLLTKSINKKDPKDFDIAATPLCLGNISKVFSVDNMKKTRLNGHVYDFSVDYDAMQWKL